MFENNPSIKNLYNKINEIEKLTKKHIRSRIILMSIILVLSLIYLFLFENNNITYFEMFSFLFLCIIVFVSFVGLVELIFVGSDPIPYVPNKTQKLLTEKKIEFSSCFSDEKVQKAIINHKKFNLINDDILRKFKTNLALKKFDKAAEIFICMTEILPVIEKKNNEKIKIDNLIKDYELNLKMKI